jgi:hypothetical protein
MDQEPHTQHTSPEGTGDTVTGVFGGDVQACLRRLEADCTLLSQQRLWAQSDTQARDSLNDCFKLKQTLEHIALQLLADLDTRPDAVPGARNGAVARTYIREKLHRRASDCTADVRAAQALITRTDPATGGLPLLAAALATGRVAREHIDIIVRTIHKIPTKILAANPPEGLHLNTDGASGNSVNRSRFGGHRPGSARVVGSFRDGFDAPFVYR